MGDKYDDVITKVENGGVLSPNERHTFKTVCSEHSSRGRRAREARDKSSGNNWGILGSS